MPEVDAARPRIEASLVSHSQSNVSRVVQAALRSLMGEGHEVQGLEYHSVGIMWLNLVIWVLFWALFFYALVATSDRWMAGLTPSSKAHENDKYWCARNVLGTIHAMWISLITVPAYLILASIPPAQLRFTYSRHLGTCTVDAAGLEGSEEWTYLFQAVALAGLSFTAFTLADVVISLLHNLATLDYIVHHVAFISAGLIIRGHCMLPYNAAILLAMEASTPSLNHLLLIRHRGEEHATAVRNNGIAFVLLFIVFRLVLNTYGFVVLISHKDAFPPDVPDWQAWFLIIAVGAGAGVQYWWFPGIVRTFGAGLSELLQRKEDTEAASATGAGQGIGAGSASRSEESELIAKF